MALLAACSCEFCYGILELFLFKVGQTKVVMSTCLVTLELDSCLQFSNRFIEPSKPAKTDSHVETGLIDILVISQCRAGLLIIIDRIFQLIEL